MLPRRPYCGLPSVMEPGPVAPSLPWRTTSLDKCLDRAVEMAGPRHPASTDIGKAGRDGGPGTWMRGASPPPHADSGTVVSALDACLGLLGEDDDDAPLSRGVWRRLMAEISASRGVQTRLLLGDAAASIDDPAAGCGSVEMEGGRCDNDEMPTKEPDTLGVTSCPEVRLTPDSPETLREPRPVSRLLPDLLRGGRPQLHASGAPACRELPARMELVSALVAPAGSRQSLVTFELFPAEFEKMTLSGSLELPPTSALLAVLTLDDAEECCCASGHLHGQPVSSKHCIILPAMQFLLFRDTG